jgi:hypothetical protein
MFINIGDSNIFNLVRCMCILTLLLGFVGCSNLSNVNGVHTPPTNIKAGSNLKLELGFQFRGVIVGEAVEQIRGNVTCKYRFNGKDFRTVDMSLDEHRVMEVFYSCDIDIPETADLFEYYFTFEIKGSDSSQTIANAKYPYRIEIPQRKKKASTDSSGE